MITIDGSHGEGGGQIVRTALALSAITGTPCRIENIRSGREQSGLKQMHLTSILALQDLCSATVRNVELGASWIEFNPGPLKKKNLSVDIGTAGSVTLTLQTLLLPLLFLNTSVKISIKGGTDVQWSAPIDHLQQVLIPSLRKYADISCTLIKRGYYPKGQGEILLHIRPWKQRPEFIPEMQNAHVDLYKKKVIQHTAFLDVLARTPPFALTVQGTLQLIKGVSHASVDLSKAEVAERQAKAARSTMHQQMNIEQSYRETASTGSGVFLAAICGTLTGTNPLHPVILSSSCLGEKGMSAENVGIAAAQALLAELASGAAVDAHTADQLIPFLALSGGSIKTSKITKHVLSNIYVCEQFLDVHFDIQGTTITCATNENVFVNN